MKSTSKLIALAVTGLGLMAGSSAHALTLIVYVNNSTWAIEGFAGDANAPNFSDTQATFTDQYTNQHHRYYTGGLFDTVVVERSDTHATLVTLSSCNNIFYIDRSVPYAYVCSTGYNGAGNGVSGGQVIDAAAFQNGDLYIGGEFTSAGGYSSTSYFSCYRWSAGWSGVSGIYTDNVVTSLSFDGSYRLVVSGDFGYVYGPITSGGGNTSLWSPNTALWNEWHDAFGDCYWTTP